MGIQMFFVTVTDERGNDRTSLSCSKEDFAKYKEREVELCIENRQRMYPLQANQTLFSQDTWNRATVRMNEERKG